jgi:two-component system phosphate regulon sensor histidine kinase PhoR
MRAWFSLFLSRLATFLAYAAAGALVSTLLGMTHAAAWGAGLGILCWLAVESGRRARFLNWLRQVQESPEAPPPQSLGSWREAAERVFRLLRQQYRLKQDSDSRLENLQAAMQASPNGLVVLDERARIEWCNRIACRHFGFDAQRDIAQAVANLLRDPLFVAYLAAKDFRESITLTSPVSTATHPLRLAVQIYPYGGGRLLMLSQDITVLAQADAMRRDFVANVSHEIRTPLTVLAGFVETMQTLPLSEDERRDYLDRMAQQTGRMQNLVNDLLMLSRLEDSPPPDAREWTVVRALLQRCETDARALSALVTGQGAPHRLIFPDARTLEEAGEIAGAAGELQSAFFNLINNAIRYTPPGGEIEVRWQSAPDGGACLIVRDNGPGFAAEHIPRLTERFYRIDNERSRHNGGTGLGLSIVKHVLQRHGAALRITSTLGHGACFAIEFPAAGLRTGKADAPSRTRGAGKGGYFE